MKSAFPFLSLLSVWLLALIHSTSAVGQTWGGGDLQINRKKAAPNPGFDASKLVFGEGLEVNYDAPTKTITVSSGAESIEIDPLVDIGNDGAGNGRVGVGMRRMVSFGISQASTVSGTLVAM